MKLSAERLKEIFSDTELYWDRESKYALEDHIQALEEELVKLRHDFDMLELGTKAVITERDQLNQLNQLYDLQFKNLQTVSHREHMELKELKKKQDERIDDRYGQYAPKISKDIIPPTSNRREE